MGLPGDIVSARTLHTQPRRHNMGDGLGLAIRIFHGPSPRCSVANPPCVDDSGLNSTHDGLDEPSRFGVLCHELAHVLLGHLGSDLDRWWPARANLDHATVEIEASLPAPYAHFPFISK
jgi:hypothetical protein